MVKTPFQALMVLICNYLCVLVSFFCYETSSIDMIRIYKYVNKYYLLKLLLL